MTETANKNTLFFPFITGLRGYAALMVFLIHTGNLYGINRPFFNRIVEFGKYGVILFFVISAFTICLSIARKEHFSFKKYIIRRFLRIAPLYFLISIICFGFNGIISGGAYYMQLFGVKSYDIFNLITHLTFTSIFFQQYQNSLIGLEWTIPLEFFYYFLIPVFFFLTKKNFLSIFVLMILGLFLISHTNVYLPIYIVRSGGGEWGLEQYLTIYSLGVLAFFLLVAHKILKKYTVIKTKIVGGVVLSIIGILYLISFSSAIDSAILLACIGLYFYAKNIIPSLETKINNTILRGVIRNSGILFLFGIVYVYIRYDPTFKNIFVAIFGMLVIVVAMQRRFVSRWVLENKAILHIGKISYSFYLLHLIVVVLMAKFNILFGIYRVGLILFVTITLATFTQKYIESPFIKGRIGSYIYEKFTR